MYQQVKDALNKYGLHIQPTSMKCMTSDITQRLTNTVRLDGPHLGVDDKAVGFLNPRASQMLGAVLAHNGKDEASIDHRLKLATRAFYAAKHIVLNRGLTRKIRCDYFAKYIVPIALYGCICWTFSIASVRKVHSWETTCLRRMFAVRRWPNVTWQAYIQKRITSAEFSFSVQRNLRKKCVHSDSKILRQNCVNHKNHKNLVSMWHFC